MLGVMNARAKEDAKYADTIAGGFEGTYPSYKVLNASLILNSLKQGATEFGERFRKAVAQPGGLAAGALQASASIASVLSEPSADQNDHIAWLKRLSVKLFHLPGK
jgi:hypothetical protein